MKHNPKLVKGISVVFVLSCISASISMFVHAESAAEPQVKAPDGYVKQDSQMTGENSVTHTYSKPSPQKAVAQQTPGQTFARYIDALPQDRRSEGIQYRELLENKQNAEMTLKILQMQVAQEEAKLKFAEAHKKLSGDDKVTTVQIPQIPNPNALATVSAPQKRVVETMTEGEIDRELQSISVDGVYKVQNQWLASVRLPDNRKVTVPSKGSVGSDIYVHVDAEKVIFRKNNSSHTVYMVN